MFLIGWNWLILNVEHPRKFPHFIPMEEKQGRETNLVSDWLIHKKIFSSETSLSKGRWAIQAQPAEPLVMLSPNMIFYLNYWDKHRNNTVTIISHTITMDCFIHTQSLSMKRVTVVKLPIFASWSSYLRSTGECKIFVCYGSSFNGEQFVFLVICSFLFCTYFKSQNELFHNRFLKTRNYADWITGILF